MAKADVYHPDSDSNCTPSDDEKHIDNKHVADVDHLPPDPDEHLSAEEKAKIVCDDHVDQRFSADVSQDRRLLWKLDLVLIPWLALLYLASFLDRTNIGNARIDSLERDLNMTGPQFNMTLTIFFISYSLFEPVTQIMLKKFRPSIFLPVIMLLWGICMTLMGLVTNYSGLLAARWFLGLTEAGLFPGVNYYLSCWYKRSEFGIRAAVFFSAAALAGSFGGLLAAAITKCAGSVANRAGHGSSFSKVLRQSPLELRLFGWSMISPTRQHSCLWTIAEESSGA